MSHSLFLWYAFSAQLLDWIIFGRPSEMLVSLGIVKAEMRVILKPLGTMLFCYRGIPWAPIIQKGAFLSVG